VKILVVTKRYTSAKDISEESVGRPSCLFEALHECGHEVSFLLADYTRKERVRKKKGAIEFDIRPFGPFRFFQFRRAVYERLDGGGYDCVIAEGDPVFALAAQRPCERLGVPFVYDLMDNYETYTIYRLPLFGMVDRRILKKAHLLVYVTGSLRRKYEAFRFGPGVVVGNGVDLDRFRPHDRTTARRRFGLPEGVPVIGYFGYIVDYKGVSQLLGAHALLRRKGLKPLLLLAGNRHRGMKLEDEGVVYRGIVPHGDIPFYIGACDVIVVPNASNDYTNYCFPLKILEALACDRTVVATDLPPVRELLGAGCRRLAIPGDAVDLAIKIEDALHSPAQGSRKMAERHSWIKRAKDLEDALRRIVSKSGIPAGSSCRVSKGYYIV
jgi:glycosyltransferase involved in cell wall biosynthesis